MVATVLQELDLLENIIERGRSMLSVRTICSVDSGGKCLPIYGIALGADRPDMPVVGFFGGVHGLLGSDSAASRTEVMHARFLQNPYDSLVHAIRICAMKLIRSYFDP